MICERVCISLCIRRHAMYTLQIHWNQVNSLCQPTIRVTVTYYNDIISLHRIALIELQTNCTFYCIPVMYHNRESHMIYNVTQNGR